MTPELIAEAQAVDYGLHDAIIDALGNEIISNAYRVNAIKIRLIRQEHTRLEPQLVVPVMRSISASSTRSRRAIRRGLPTRSTAHISQLRATGRSASDALTQSKQLQSRKRTSEEERHDHRRSASAIRHRLRPRSQPRLAMPAIVRGQGETSSAGATCCRRPHPQVQMIERIAKEVEGKDRRAASRSRAFPAGQLGSGKDMIEAVSAGNLTMTTDGAAALGQFLPQISLIEAPYLWRDAAHMAKALRRRLLEEMNTSWSTKRGMRMLAPTYYGKRHLTTGTRR